MCRHESEGKEEGEGDEHAAAEGRSTSRSIPSANQIIQELALPLTQPLPHIWSMAEQEEMMELRNGVINILNALLPILGKTREAQV